MKKIIQSAAALIIALAVIGIIHFAGQGLHTVVAPSKANAQRYPPNSIIGGIDTNNQPYSAWVDSSGYLHVVVSNPSLPDAGNTAVPADQCTTVWHHGVVLVGNTPTLVPATELFGRKWILLTNAGPNTIWWGGSTVGADDAGTNMGTPLYSTQTISIPFSGNSAFSVYAISETPQTTPTKGNPNGTTYNECY